jgi:hypothetical protein
MIKDKKEYWSTISKEDEVELEREIRVLYSDGVTEEELKEYEVEQAEIEARGYPEWMDEDLAKVWNARCNLISMQLRSPDNALLKESIALLTEYMFPKGEE